MKGKLAALTLALLASATAATAAPPNRSTTVVLVHGAFVDGAGWKAVHDELIDDGYEVLVVQNSTETLTGDVAAAKRTIVEARYPVVLVGHSYGGAVITEAGGDPKVRSLVYLAAFAPDAGESVQSLLGGFPKDAPAVPIVAKDGFLTLERDKFLVQFAPDAPRDVAAFMAASQVPWGQAAPATKITVPAWRAKPTYYIVASDDLIIPPSAQRDMAKRAAAKTTEVKSSHAVMISHPHEVTAAIETAAASAN